MCHGGNPCAHPKERARRARGQDLGGFLGREDGRRLGPSWGVGETNGTGGDEPGGRENASRIVEAKHRAGIKQQLSSSSRAAVRSTFSDP
jgi:hypothetical protein